MPIASTIDNKLIDIAFVFLSINANMNRTTDDAKKNVSTDIA